MLIDISDSGMTSRDFAIRLLRQHNVAVAPGSCFGSATANYIRLSLASSEENIIAGIEGICKMLGTASTTTA